MQYLITFLEGIITFISPCLLPMIPIYVAYLAGDRKPLTGALGFVTGFTIMFCAMGALAGTLGAALAEHQRMVNLVCGLVVIAFGLSYLGVFRIGLFKGVQRQIVASHMNFFSALLFGVVFSVGWTPCVGAFLGSALLLASQQGHGLQGMLMLLVYSLGLGIPFILSAVLIKYVKTVFDWIKRHYAVINRICGVFLIVMGVLMATGTLGYWLALLS